MRDLDQTDRNLIAHLKLDGRASVTRLAGLLGVSRATVQSRMERLVAQGTIRRFTVELDAKGADDLIHAVMMIEIEGDKETRVNRQLRRMAEITSLHTTNGAWDLVAQIECPGLPEFDQVLRKIRNVPGVLNSETCLLLDKAGS